ncbi:TIGR04222 domain-containing membrane protein [Nonomuraea africana]|uniref:TIGR04222 domain-containing membrane protein n=1 Tax=Nonomuraea africana TaxID=46171 RepID=UPI0033C200AF
MDLLLLLLALVLIAAVNGASSALRREHGRVRAVAANAGPGELGHYELAYLAGGPRRVVNTAIALMARAGALRVSRGGTLHLVASAFSADPVERAVLDAVRARPGGVSAGVVRHEVGTGPAMEDLRHHLMTVGLLVPDGSLVPVRSRLNRLTVLACLSGAVGLVTAALMVTGAVPVGPLALATLLISAILAISGLVAAARHRRALGNVLSTAGQAELLRAQRLHVRGASRSHAPQLAFAVGVPVALYGLSELDDPALQQELRSEEDQGHTASSGGCAGGSCGGGSGSDSSYGGADFGSSASCSSGGGGGGGGSGCGGGGGCGGGCGGG